MSIEEYNHIKSLFEELANIVKSSSVGNNREPVWDGTVIGKPNQHTLVRMGLAECLHGYYFATEKGMEIYKLFTKKSQT